MRREELLLPRTRWLVAGGGRRRAAASEGNQRVCRQAGGREGTNDTSQWDDEAPLWTRPGIVTTTIIALIITTTTIITSTTHQPFVVRCLCLSLCMQSLVQAHLLSFTASGQAQAADQDVD
jgi:hypothetical protein